MQKGLEACVCPIGGIWCYFCFSLRFWEHEKALAECSSQVSLSGQLNLLSQCWSPILPNAAIRLSNWVSVRQGSCSWSPASSWSLFPAMFCSMSCSCQVMSGEGLILASWAGLCSRLDWVVPVSKLCCVLYFKQVHTINVQPVFTDSLQVLMRKKC